MTAHMLEVLAGAGLGAMAAGWLWAVFTYWRNNR